MLLVREGLFLLRMREPRKVIPCNNRDWKMIVVIKDAIYVRTVLEILVPHSWWRMDSLMMKGYDSRQLVEGLTDDERV